MADLCEMCNQNLATTGVKNVKLCRDCFETISKGSDQDIQDRFYQQSQTSRNRKSLCDQCGSTLRLVRKKGETTGEILCITCTPPNGICPLCHARLRTKQAQQCPKCKASWHIQSKPSLTGLSHQTKEQALTMGKEISRCPQCGFAFNFDGLRCGHCGYRQTTQLSQQGNAGPWAAVGAFIGMCIPALLAKHGSEQSEDLADRLLQFGIRYFIFSGLLGALVGYLFYRLPWYIACIITKPSEHRSVNAHKAESTGISRLSIIENKLKDKNEKEEDN